MKIDTGLIEADRKSTAEHLAHLLADTYTLYLKTHSFHWNVTGPMFYNLHLLFEQQYTTLALAVDEIAERIRALGFPAPGSYSQFKKLAAIQEESGVPAAEEMLRQLLADHETIADRARKLCSSIEPSHDQTTVDLLTRRMENHEKNAWMLRSLLA